MLLLLTSVTHLALFALKTREVLKISGMNGCKEKLRLVKRVSLIAVYRKVSEAFQLLDRNSKTPMVEARAVVGSLVRVKTPNHYYEGMVGVCRGRGHVLLDGKEKCVRIFKADLEKI